MSSKTATLLSNNDQFEHSLLTAWIDSANVKLRAIDDGGTVVTLKQAARLMLGVVGTKVLDGNCRFLQGNELHQPGLAAIRTGINLQANGYAELQNFRRDGSLLINELIISPVKGANGVVSHFVGIHPLEASQVSH